MASLIILIKTDEFEYIDPTKGQYLFGISRVNETLIDNGTYQYSNRFDDLIPGLYQWAVKNTISGLVKSRGNDVVVNDPSECYTKFVVDSNNITILQTTHKRLKVSDVECFYNDFDEEGNKIYLKFLPDNAAIDLYNNVVVTTETPFTGKITIC